MGLIFRVVINNQNTLLVLRALQCSSITFNFMTILLLFITNLSACTITTKRRRIYDVTLPYIYIYIVTSLKSYEDKKKIKNKTKTYFYKVSNISKHYVTKFIIILKFLFEQDRYGFLQEKQY